MNTSTHKALARAAAAGLAGAALMPGTAFAEAADEGGSSGIQLLIPTLAELIPAAIAFLIIFLVLSKLVWPAVVKMMDEREQSIVKSFEEADTAKAEAVRIERESEEMLSKARAEAAEIVAAGKREAEDERSRILAEAKIEAAETIEKGHAAIDSERKRAMGELSKSVVDLSVEIAGRIIDADLDDEAHRQLAARYLDEVGSEDADE